MRRRSASPKYRSQSHQIVFNKVYCSQKQKMINWNRIIQTIKKVIDHQLEEQFEEVKRIVVNLMQWIRLYLNGCTLNSETIIQNTNNLFQINSKDNNIQLILDQVTNNKNNVINNLMRVGFFPYLLKKYSRDTSTQPLSFLSHFSEDIKWYKNHLSNLIYNIYSDCICKTKNTQDYFEQLMNLKSIEIITSQHAWKPVYKMFLSCLEDPQIKFDKRIVQSPLFFEMQPHFSCIAQGIVPFQNTVCRLKKLMKTYEAKKVVNMLREIYQDSLQNDVFQYQSRLLKQDRIKQIKSIDADNKFPCIQYCIFKSDQPFSKVIKYINSMYQENTILKNFSISGHIMLVMEQAYEYLLKRQSNGQIQDKQMMNEDPRKYNIKFQNFRVFGNSFNQQKLFNEFKTKEPNWMPVYSSVCVFPKSRLKIQIKGSRKNICIGVCSLKASQSNTRMFEKNQESIFLNIERKSIISCGSRNPINFQSRIKQEISYVLMQIEQSQISWILNDDVNYVFRVSLDKLKEKSLVGFASLRRGAEFQIIDV